MDGDRPPENADRAHDARVADLAARWARARRAALQAVLGSDAGAVATEDELVARAVVVDLRETLRRGFDNSRRLGRGYAHTFEGPLALGELQTLLPVLGTPCLRGAWRSLEREAATLERAPCVEDTAPHLCDWWREVTDGLVIGLSARGDDVVRHTRHRSRGHGDASCVDVLYARAESPLRYGSIPDDMRSGLDAIARTLQRFDSRAVVRFLGVSEGVLLYQRPARGCADESSLDVNSMLEKALARRFPQLATLEISPRGVLADDGVVREDNG